MIAEEVKADLFEIEPKVPYTKPDLDWMNKKSRSSVEMSDKKYRPEIIKKEMDMSSYDEILLGFPIWWYVAPTIINTFLEAYDFSGKKIVLFATSGGSGFGNTVKELQPSAPEAVITEGSLYFLSLISTLLRDFLFIQSRSAFVYGIFGSISNKSAFTSSAITGVSECGRMIRWQKKSL